MEQISLKIKCYKCGSIVNYPRTFLKNGIVYHKGNKIRFCAENNEVICF